MVNYLTVSTSDYRVNEEMIPKPYSWGGYTRVGEVLHLADDRNFSPCGRKIEQYLAFPTVEVNNSALCRACRKYAKTHQEKIWGY